MALPTAKELELARKTEVILDFGDAPEDPSDEPEHAPTELHHASRLPPGSGNYDWASIREHLIRHRLAKGRGADGRKLAKVKLESDEAAVTVTEFARRVELAELPSSTKGFLQRALDKGWEIGATRSATHRAATLYQADSKEGDKNEHSRGDVLYPAEDRVHWRAFGRLIHPDGRDFARFHLTYETRDGKNGYEGAEFWDRLTGERALARKVGEFEDWFGIFCPKPAPKTKKKPKLTMDEQLLNGDDWDGE